MPQEDDALDPHAATLGPHALGSPAEEPSSHADETTREARAPASPATPPAVPARLGRYTVLGVLGQGGMGIVHEARDEQVGRKVALKLLHAELAGQHAERLVREARALARLSHPNVVQVYEVGKVDERWFIAMELVPGRTLRDWQRDRPSWRECLRAYRQAGRGLAAAHAAGMTHRDFKPGNCIIDGEGRVRVLDFGLARQAGDASMEPRSGESQLSLHDPAAGSLTRTGEVLGTLGYMPFEQLEGKRANARSDQWSFCASLYEALYGERPFAADAVGALTLAMMRNEIRPAPKGSDVPRRLRRVLLRGLSKDPHGRWPSMDALLAALAAIEARRARWMIGAGVVLVAGPAIGLGLLPRTDPTLAAPADVPDPPRRVMQHGQPPSPMALELRERAKEAFAARRFGALSDHLERLAPWLPDDPTLEAEVLLWRGLIHPDAEDGAALLRKAYFLAQDADVPSIEARAAGALAGSTFGAHAEGVDEWMRLAWVAVERTPWDRSATIEVAVTVAHATAQAWWILGDESHARAVLEFADATVGEVELEDDAFVAWQLVLLSIGWRYIGEHERALHWGLQARSLLSAIAGPEHPLWAEVNDHTGRAIHRARPDHCEDALGYLEEALTGYLGRGDEEAASVVRLELARCSRQLGQHEAGLEHARRAADYWASHPPLFMTNRQSAHLEAGYLLAALGREAEAEAELRHLLTLVDLEASSEPVRNEAKQALERLRSSSPGTRD